MSLPQINDLLVVLMVTEHKAWMPYYAAMATLGSVAGCFVIYYLAEQGRRGAPAEARVEPGASTARSALYRRHGLLALMVPALLPPPAPFKLFVLGAGIAGVRPVQVRHSASPSPAALRYLALGMLAIYYGDAALELMRTHGRVVGLSVAAIIVAGAVAWSCWRASERRMPDAPALSLVIPLQDEAANVVAAARGAGAGPARRRARTTR